MPSMSEIRTEWKAVKSALGLLINYMDGKAQKFGEAEESWQKGYDCGHADGYKQGHSDGWNNAYEDGMCFAWNLILAIGGLANGEIRRVFELGNVVDPLFAVVKRYTPDEAAEILKAYDDNKPIPKTNAEMFRSVFPCVDSIDKLVKIVKGASERHCLMRSEWWDESYAESEEDDEHTD